MKRGLVLVEGQTEERFVNECLTPHLLTCGLAIERATVVTTKRNVGAPYSKGGVVRYKQVQNDLRRLLNDSNVSVITTLFDYYALPDDFPGMADRPAGSPRDRVHHVEAAWSRAVGDRRFIPHLVHHEFEAWIYADPGRLEPWMFSDDPSVVATIAEIAAAHASPEDIDEGADTAPSRRLCQAFSAYQKTLHGPLAAAAIGLERIRAVCPHFDSWLGALEAAARSAAGSRS
jgi:hypothetical protein